MKVSFLNVILLIMIIFACEKSQALQFIDVNENPSSSHVQLSCLECHPDISKGLNHDNTVEFGNLSTFPHADISCLECHKASAMVDHENQEKTNCLDCHVRHNEKITHDAHIDVPCLLCHMENVKPIRLMEGNRQIWGYDVEINGETDPHRMISEKSDICLKCHYKDNNLGASDHVMPAKSIVCMPCHTSTFSAGDIPSIAAIIIFLMGVACILISWLSAGKGHNKRKRINIVVLLNIIKTLILDGFFQRRLLKVSPKRWFIHSMIFFPFIFRFFWGVAALVLSLYNPEWDTTWSMINKNNPLTGFLFDFSGMLILLGGCLMVLEKRADKARNSIQDMPEGKSFIHVLLGLIIITGFILEGARIAMTGSPDGSEFAFIGYGISRVLVNVDLQGIYIYLWYIHAVITGAFIAYLPFSRMVHVIVAPLSIYIKAVSDKER
jgi:nitrate reductase gamma subunit